MQPIKTANAMNPAPAKGIESFPTPVIDDVVIAEVVNAWKGDYQKLEYGTLWKDVSHAPNQGSFPEHKLVFQQPTSEDGQWIKRIWVNDRVNQDSYNYAIKYSAGSQQHPIYIRTYIVPRETYTPLPDGTPDPLFPIAVLVDEEATRIEGELDSKYISVTRVYETLPGPEVPTKRYNERGDLETVIVQTVPPFTPPDPDGLLVTGSQVVQEEMGKGVKTTSTVEEHSLLQIKEKKEGLLGETITTDDIVDPSTNPDALSQTIVSSSVEQFSATKSRKRTTTSTGPTSLTQKSKDGKLIGDVTITESVVAPNTNPDAVSTSLLASEVKQVDSGKAIKRNTILNSTPTLLGSNSKEGLLGRTTVSETVVNSGTIADAPTLSIVSSSVEPIDSVRSRKITVTSTGPTTLSGKEKKEGLLGETTVTESIVSAGTNADALSHTVVSSSVQPIDSAKSKKTTITSTGPTFLTGKKNNSGLLGEQTITERIVAAGSPPPPLSLEVISSEVTPIDSAKSKQTVITGSVNQLSSQTLVDSPIGLVNAISKQTIVKTGESPSGNLLKTKDSITPIDKVKSEREEISVEKWPIVSGVDYDETLGLPIQYTETIVSPDEYDDVSEWTNIVDTNYKPLDQWKSLKRKYNKEEIVTALGQQYYSLETQVNISLPDTLQQVVVYTGGSFSEGRNLTNTLDTGGQAYSYSNSGGYESSSSISADVYFKIRKGFNGYIRGRQHIFFMPINENGIVQGSVLDALNEKNNAIIYSPWPVIRQTSENIVVITGSSSTSFSEGNSRSVSLNGFANSTRTDKSGSSSSNANSITLPESLHGELPITYSDGTNFPLEFSIVRLVYPSSLSPTNPPIFPVGNYLMSSQMELYKWGMVKVTAITAAITSEYI